MYAININDDSIPQTLIFNERGLQIAETMGDDNTEAEATAKLFAAAPDLLAALKALIQASGIDENDLASLAEPEAFKQAIDAIKKAENN